MRCDKVSRRLSEYMEGTLKDGDVRALEAHLEVCPECRNELESLRELDARLREEVPGLWESIEPAPDFVARLKRLDLEPQPSFSFRIAAAFSSLWQEHRMALATGLSVCLVIALVFTVPGILPSDDDEAPIVSESLAPTAPEAAILSEDTAGKGISQSEEGDISDRGMVAEAAPAPIPAPAAEPTPAPTAPPEEMAAAMPSAPSFDVFGFTPPEAVMAENIALESHDVQQAIEGRSYRVIGVYEIIDEVDFDCGGPIVTMALEEAGTPTGMLYICVDLGEGTVSHTTFLPQ